MLGEIYKMEQDPQKKLELLEDVKCLSEDIYEEENNE